MIYLRPFQKRQALGHAIKCKMMEEKEVFILENKYMEVHIAAYGATLQRIVVKGSGKLRKDVLLGLERAEDYETAGYAATGAYLGALVGRYANRIAGGQFAIDGQEYQLAINNGRNHLHGGICGFDKKRWKPVAYDGSKSLTLRYDSPDGEEGYPGNLQASVCFQLDMRELRIQYRATCDKPCYVNLTHHPYFNLEGEGDIRGHVLKLYSGHYLRTEDLIPDGTLAEAKGTACDFTMPHVLERVIEERGGLDDCFVFGGTGMVKRMAGLSDSRASIVLFVASDYPGLQVYTGRYLDVPGGRDGQHYGAYAGVALEPQFYPDSPHHPEFPSALLQPGEEYAHEITYSFAMND